MHKIPFTENTYCSPERQISWVARKFPNIVFWLKALRIIFCSSRLAKRGKYDSEQWVDSSIRFLRALESVGVKLQIENLQVLRNLTWPCVFIGNHMSTLETFILPGILRPLGAVTFVVKKQLVETPVFKHVMLSRNPVVVGRTNPREDFKTVIEEGQQRLADDMAVIVFPQTTRAHDFDSSQFNSIGVKLAKHAHVPVVPIALKTDAWGNGKLIKDLGKIDPTKVVRLCFHEPITIQGNGKQEHQQMIDFIREKLEKWG